MLGLDKLSSEQMIGIGVVIFLFFILREFVTWYFKLSKISDSLGRIEKALNEIDETLSKRP